MFMNDSEILSRVILKKKKSLLLTVVERLNHIKTPSNISVKAVRKKETNVRF